MTRRCAPLSRAVRGTTTRSIALVAALVTAASTAHGQDTDAPLETADLPPGLLAPEEGAAPPLLSGDYDWIQFTSGEWLKGEIKDMQDDSFVFDSDQLDELTIDWEDVQAVYSKRSNTVGFDDKEVVEGTLRVEGDTVTVTTADGEEKTFTRDEMRAIVPGPRTELNLWSGKLSLGATVRSGNVDQTDISGFVQVQRRDVYTRLNFEYDGTYGEVDGERTINTHRGTAFYDWYFTDELYWRIFSFTGFSDEFQNIEYRLTPGTGVGWEIINDGTFEWSIFGGFGWEFVRYVDPAPGFPKTSDSPAALAGSRFKWEATSRVDLGVDFDLTVPIRTADMYSFRAVFWTEVEIYGDLDLDVRFTWDRQNNPVPNSDGTRPDPDDFRLYLGVGWNF